jgi:hypothetical protein
MPGSNPTAKLANSIALLAAVVSVCGLVLSRALPEPAPTLPED